MERMIPIMPDTAILSMRLLFDVERELLSRRSGAWRNLFQQGLSVFAREAYIVELAGGPTMTRTWDRRIMSPSQTINHNSPQQPASHFLL